MEEKLKAYMENLFRDVPDSEQAREIKEEILQNITDKYHDLLAEGKSEEAAYNIAVEGIGDLGELLESLKKKSADSSGTGTADTNNSYGNTLYQDPEYKEWKRKSAIRTAISVMLYILSIIPPIISDEVGGNDAVGPSMMFCMIAVATAILVFNSMTKPSYTKNGDTVADEFMAWKHKNNTRKQTWRSIHSALWSIIVVLYFIISFTTMAWHITWVIYLVGAAISSILKVFELNTNGSGGSRVVQITCGIIALVAILFLVLFFVFHIFGGGISFPAFQIFGGNHYENADKYTAGNVSIQPETDQDNPLSEIYIDWIDGTVEIAGVAGLKEIEIEEEDASSRPKSDQVHSYYHDGILEIQYQESGFSFFKKWAANKNLKIRIPEELARNIRETHGDFVSSDVTINGLQMDILDLDSVSGQTMYTGLVRKEINLDNVSGNTSLNLADTPSALTSDSVSGDIFVTLPSSASFEAELDTVSGKIKSELPVTSSDKEDGDYEFIRCGDGKGKFDFDTVSGDIEFKSAKTAS